MTVAPSAPVRARGAARGVLMAAAAAPPVVAATLLVLFVILDLAGHTPFSYPMPRNIAEAAGMGNGSEVLRMLRQGQDPTAIWPVSPDIISSSITRVTALEAAVWGRRVQLLRLLEREGAIRDDEARQSIACLAMLARVPAIVAEFAPAGVRACDQEEFRERLEARSP